MFAWTLDDIRIGNIISTPISVTKCFLEVSALLDARYCPKLRSCAISRKFNNATLRKWQKTNFGTRLSPPKFFQGFYLY